MDSTEASCSFKYCGRSLSQNLCKLPNFKISSPAQDSKVVVRKLNQVNSQRKAIKAVLLNKDFLMASMSHYSSSEHRKRKWCRSHETQITSIWSREDITEQEIFTNHRYRESILCCQTTLGKSNHRKTWSNLERLCNQLCISWSLYKTDRWWFAESTFLTQRIIKST